MKKLQFLFLSLLFLSLLVFLAGERHPGSAQAEPSIQEEYVLNEVLVKFKKGISRDLIQYGIDQVQGKIKTHLGAEIATQEWDPEISNHRSFLADPDLFHVKFPQSVGTEQAVYILNLNPNVIYAEKNYIWNATVNPNDTYFYKLWGLHNQGLPNQGNGTPDADIDAPEAWSIHTGSSNVVVAVIDTGIRYDHLDLQDNIWTNPGETGGGKENNNIDDDGNGKIDDWRGWNFVSGNNNPLDNNSAYYHGTHVAGTIGAKGNNNKGVVGVCWNVKLMALKAGNSSGEFTSSNIINAIDYSTNKGARLSNNSYAGTTYSQAVLEAIYRAQSSGKLFIAAAGNDGVNNDLIPHYPASYDLDNIVSVAATDHFDNKAGYSDLGPYSVDVGAPGGTDLTEDTSYNIYSTKLEPDSYRYLDGTSMASPLVAGEAALIWAHRPSLNWWQVKNLIMKSVDPKDSLFYFVNSGGRINAYNALTRPTPNLPTAPSNLIAWPFDCDIKLTWTDNSNNENGFEIHRKQGYVFHLIGTTGANVTTSWDYELPPGHYYYYLRAYNSYGTSQKTLQQGATATQCQ